MNTFTWTLRVSSPDRHTARVSARRHQFVAHRPLSFDADLEGVTALEYAFGAIGAEIVTGLRELARRRRLELEEIEAVVTGELKNPLAYLEVVGDEGSPAIERVHVKIYVRSTETEAAIRTLCGQASDLLPLTRTFRELVHLELHIEQTS